MAVLFTCPCRHMAHSNLPVTHARSLESAVSVPGIQACTAADGPVCAGGCDSVEESTAAGSHHQLPWADSSTGRPDVGWQGQEQQQATRGGSSHSRGGCAASQQLAGVRCRTAVVVCLQHVCGSCCCHLLPQNRDSSAVAVGKPCPRTGFLSQVGIPADGGHQSLSGHLLLPIGGGTEAAKAVCACESG